MEEQATLYKFLIHCKLHQIREGFEASIRKLPYSVETHYANLLQDGIMSELKYDPHLVVLLQHDSDSDYLLPLKVKLFARHHPVLVVAPAIPDGYYNFLKIIGINHIVQLPAGDESICRTITCIINGLTRGKP